jgi:hypothetical protein
MLAGRHPREDYRPPIEDAVRRDDLVTVATLLRERPGNLPSTCSPYLDAIVRKTLAPQPGHRYQSATLLLEDIQRFTSGEQTLAYQQLVAAGRATRVVARAKPAPADAPTMPVPAASRAAAAPAEAEVTVGVARPAPPSPGAPPRLGRRRWLSRRSAGVVLRAIAALLVARFIIGEGVVWSRADRFRGRIAGFEAADLASIPPMVRSLRNGAVFGFAASRVNGPLASRMLELAEPTLADYRTDMPAAKQGQWKAAAAALKIATDAEPRNREIRARARYIEGHLLRIDALGRPADQARPLLERAVAAFKDAAQLDSGWPDPYLGLAALHAYGFRDVTAVAQDVSEAARRGFTGGRREHAEVADAFSYRGDQSRASAARATGDDRLRLLAAAASDYQSCVDHYTGVEGYFNSDKNLDRCQRLHDGVTRDLQSVSAAAQP